jgi:hypothetical protein
MKMNNMKNIEWKKSSIDYDKLNELTHKQIVASNMSSDRKKTDEEKQKISKKLKGKPKSEEHKNSLKGKRLNPGMMGKSKSEAKINAAKVNARLGGLTGAGGKATQEKYGTNINAYKYPSMEYVGTYVSIKDAGRQLDVNFGNISNVLKQKSKQAKGYTFKKLI